VKLSPGLAKLFRDAEKGTIIPEVEITLNKIGNGKTYTLGLSRVLISSIQYIRAGESPEAEITLVSR
jgi:type VI protein secretion system component Hcp